MCSEPACNVGGGGGARGWRVGVEMVARSTEFPKPRNHAHELDQVMAHPGRQEWRETVDGIRGNLHRCSPGVDDDFVTEAEREKLWSWGKERGVCEVLCGERDACARD